jgi:hypothetical protein
MSIFAAMRVGRVAFYIITLIAIGEVTNLSSQFRQDLLAICYADGFENPLEEDESREAEDEEDLICLATQTVPTIILNNPGASAQSDAHLPEPPQSIIVPPPQA